MANSTSPSCTWTPTTAGWYYLSVAAWDSGTGTGATATAWYAVTGSSLTKVSLTTSPASPEPVNTSKLLTAAATGGTNVQYQFWVYNASTQLWNALQTYSMTATCSWTPATAGWYYLSTSARDGLTGQEVSNTAWYNVGSMTSLTLSTSPASPQPINTRITLSATATGGTNIQYQFWVYSATTQTWSPLQGTSASSSCSWTPATAGSYYLSATAQDGATGIECSATCWFTVQ